MGTQDFARFVEKQQELAASSSIDWGKMRDEWLSDLDALYQTVRGFLEKYIENGSITVSFTGIELIEENLGSYEARKMEIKIGAQRIYLVPVGTLIVGSKGRVDVEGTAGRAQLLLLDERAKNPADLIKITVNIKGDAPPIPPVTKEPIHWVWKIVTNTKPRKFVDLDQESCMSLLMEVANA